jgi:hypothetical protein
MGNKIHLAVVAVILAVASLAPAALARPSKDVTYGGKTSAKWPVMVQLSRDGRQVSYAAAAWRADCSGMPYSSIEEFDAIPVSRTGKFAKSYDTGDFQDGTSTIHAAASITGKLNKQRTKINGTVRVTLSVKDATEGVDFACDTGTVHYVAIN